ncbi:phosphinothricin N-acetyltransferase (PPT N-acetyltransferase) (Phosphinothricin-resistance protein) [Treponema primitia ZAS-2]|uniref:Phosphinothricin N-acetyltransferase (PPT N-acetyltransferase) (Phosphinothricin-resistance protein) n=1 Tax=Treponema primitia (strain ATCC BAA-887 / DSM 12427 / ZAS-2) TaxID=545694 RepID=F5YP84_TREPZ|nr:GNAT family N-acetyltransferase [Treponema primitia]AEF85027.1 phosphinothricin N-acetyltransferase (PPT N-acetyltransferase) (Phosphinothricin-resistance protein) [Treponema primitia ZAS-2]
MIRSVKTQDAESICGIYNYFIQNTVATFEELSVPVEEMESRIAEVCSGFPWIVWEDAGQVLGYAYAHQWKERSAYRYSVENSIYIKHGFEGKGLGQKLLSSLLGELRKMELRTIVAGITLPNDRSMGLHEKFGFKKVAQFPEIGYKMDQWLDVGYWTLNLKNEFSKEEL